MAIACLVTLAGCNESSTQPAAENPAVFDSARLPRVTGAKEIFASPATTNFTSPDTVAQTAETLEKSLAGAGWQKYIAPNTAYANDPSMRIMSLKKGAQALNVFITVAPAQNNATSVQYSALPLKTDLPFAKDASNIEYSPERALLTLVSAEPIDKTLDFYRKELGARGWAMWSEKTNGKAAADAAPGVVHERGGYAHYVTDKDPSVALVLTVLKADAGKTKVEIKQWPVGILEPLHQAYLKGGTNAAAVTDVTRLPRLEGAQVDAANNSSDRLSYSAPGSVRDVIAATKKLLAADGWRQYVAPLEETHETLLSLKKGGQGMTVHFTMVAGKPGQSSVNYSSARLGFALPFSDDATDIVFDDNRPYLNFAASGTIESSRAFFEKELSAAGWSRLSASDAAARWPGATLDETAANGARVYFISENKRPIVLSLQQRDGGKIEADIRVPPFAQAQTLEIGDDIYNLPTPKLHKTAGGTNGQTEREMHAHVPAAVGTVLAFYRRELAKRNWTEQTENAVLKPDEATLKYVSPDGPAVLTLTHKYDFTVVSLVQQVPRPAAKAEASGRVADANDTVDAMLKQAMQMARDATADAKAVPAKPPQKLAQAGNEQLRPLADNKAPVPVPENSADVEYDGEDGKLEFSSTADVRMVADFYRAVMKQQGWASQSSVINNANMVVLNFTKAGKPVSFTIIKMGPNTNVTAEGPALKTAGAKPAGAAPATANADTPSQPATEDDLIAEESGGLPVPRRHTLATGEKSPFRRNLNANVPLPLADVLGFYRRELGKLNWKEEAKGAVTAADKATLAFASGEGPALLTLGRKDGETFVVLTVRYPDAAAKAGVLPKPGQTKLLISNPNEVEGTLTINKQTVKVVAGGGMKGSDGAMLDVAPGKYKVTSKLPGKPAKNDEIEVGADQTWGLLIGPGGVLPLQVY